MNHAACFLNILTLGVFIPGRQFNAELEGFRAHVKSKARMTVKSSVRARARMTPCVVVVVVVYHEIMYCTRVRYV